MPIGNNLLFDMGKTFFLCTHYLTSVPFDDLVKYLCQDKKSKIYAVKLPLFVENSSYNATLEEYRLGSLFKTIKISWKLPISSLRYLYDVVVAIRFGLIAKRCDIAVGFDGLCVISCILLRILGRIKRVIFYTIDFTPKRYQSTLINFIFHTVDAFCVRLSDLVWNVSPRIEIGRTEKSVRLTGKTARQIVVPIGTWIDEYVVPSRHKRDKYTIMYAGGLSKHQGVDLVIRALPAISQRIPEIKFEIIGDGAEKHALQNLVAQLGLDNRVKFLGYFEKHEDVIHELMKGSLAVAMYNGQFATWSHYADPSKIKSYLACGLPTITTNITYFSEHLVKNNCGCVINYDADQLCEVIVAILSDPSRLRAMQKRSLIYAQNFNWNLLFEEGFNSLDRH